MGKVNILTVLVVTVLQVLIGYLWYSPHFFGDVMTTGGHGVDYLKTDILSLVLILFSSYGLVHVLDLLIKLTGSKDVGGGLRTGLMVGTFAVGLPMVTLLNLMGFDKIILLIVFCHVVLLSVISSIVIIKLKKI